MKEKQKLKEIKEAAADKKRGAAAVPGKLVTCFNGCLLCMGSRSMLRKLCFAADAMPLSGKASKKTKSADSHILVDSDAKVWGAADLQIPSAAAWQRTWDMTQPFIFSKTDECFEDEVLKKAIKNFASLFKESSVRVTEGRAQAPVNADIGQGFAAKFEKKAAVCDNRIDVMTKMGSEDQKA